MGLKLSELDGIVFDMDGVIFDSEAIGLESWERLGKKYGLTNVHENAMKCIGRSTVDTMAILEAAYGDKVSIPELYDEAKAICADIIAERGLPLKSGARELLSYLKEHDIKVGLASSTSYKGVIKNLKGAGLLDYFHVIIGGDMIKHSKPQPEIYLLACEKLGVRPEKTVAVEDSYNGIKSAYNAKMIPIMVPDLIAPTDEILSMVYKKMDSLTLSLNILKHKQSPSAYHRGTLF